MSNTYATPDMRPITKELREVLSNMATTKAQAFTKLATELEKNMREPNWTLETTNQVEGTVGEARISLQSTISFTFNSDDLTQPPVLNNQEKVTLEQLAQEIGGISEGETLAQVVAQSVEPQVVGKVTSAQSQSMFVTVAHGKKTALALASKGYCLLKPVTEAVLVDFALMMSPLDLNGQLLFVLDEALFSQHVYVAKALLQDRTTFKQRYQWTDDTHGKQLSITIDAAFTPHA